MLSKLLFKKNVGFPYVSCFLLLSCLLVSLPTYFSLKYYSIFGASDSSAYPWQNPITSQLEHGSYLSELTGEGIPLMIHLLGNVLVILIFGCMAERVLGTFRFLLLSITAGLVSYLLMILFHMYENGASGIVWAYGPVALVILIQLFRRNRKRLLKDILFNLSVLLFFLMWIVISYLGGLSTLLFHLASTIVGAVFTWIWRNAIHIRVNKIDDNEELPKLTNPKLVALSTLLPLFIITILILSNTGAIPITGPTQAALPNLFYIKDGSLYHTPLDNINPTEIAPDSTNYMVNRDILFFRVSEDGRRLYYSDNVDLTKENACADVYYCDLANLSEERLLIDTKINNYVINQDGTKIYYVKDKILYVNDLSETHQIASNVSQFFIDRTGNRVVYVTLAGDLVLYTSNKETKEIDKNAVIHYASEDLNTIYYFNGNIFCRLKDGKELQVIDTDIYAVLHLYEDGSLYYLKSSDQTLEVYSLYYYSNGQSTLVSDRCSNVWRNQDKKERLALHMDAFVGTKPLRYDSYYCGNDRPLMVYSQPKADNSSDEVYVCGGSKVLGKLADEMLDRCKYDMKNNKLFYTYVNDNSFVNDLYCVTLSDTAISDIRLYAEDSFLADNFLQGESVIYFKNEDSFEGDLYINQEKVDHFVNVLFVHWDEGTDSFLYECNKPGSARTLKLYQDRIILEVTENVYWYQQFVDGRIAYSVGSPPDGQLYLYDGTEERLLVDKEIAVITTPLINKYYSYWDSRPPYEME